jgi:hypothetical protein
MAQNNGDSQLNELSGEIQVSLKVCAVDDVQDSVGTLTDEIITGDDLLQGVGRKGINARQVGDDNAVVLLELTFLFFDSNARQLPTN